MAGARQLAGQGALGRGQGHAWRRLGCLLLADARQQRRGRAAASERVFGDFGACFVVPSIYTAIYEMGGWNRKRRLHSPIQP